MHFQWLQKQQKSTQELPSCRHLPSFEQILFGLLSQAECRMHSRASRQQAMRSQQNDLSSAVYKTNNAGRLQLHVEQQLQLISPW